MLLMSSVQFLLHVRLNAILFFLHLSFIVASSISRIVVLVERPCPQGSLRTNLQVLVLVLGPQVLAKVVHMFYLFSCLIQRTFFISGFVFILYIGILLFFLVFNRFFVTVKHWSLTVNSNFLTDLVWSSTSRDV